MSSIKLTAQEIALLQKYNFQLGSETNNDQSETIELSRSEIDQKKSEIRVEMEKLQAQKNQLVQATDFETFYPSQIMTSAWEIFYAWIIRMIMTGKYFTGIIPFERYFCHAWVLDEKGLKMSKSLGNVVDPSTEIAKYSSDVVRLCLLASSVPGKNLRYQAKNAEKYRNFVTKIVNVAKFLQYQESLIID